MTSGLSQLRVFHTMCNLARAALHPCKSPHRSSLVFSSRDMSWARSLGEAHQSSACPHKSRQLSNVQATLKHNMTQVSANHKTGASEPMTRQFCPARPPKGKNLFTEQTAVIFRGSTLCFCNVLPQIY